MAAAGAAAGRWLASQGRGVAQQVGRMARVVGRAALGAGVQGARRGSLRWRRMSAPSFFVTSFAALILVGTAGFLWLPGLYAGPGLGFLDALFTATSAVCVTGLIVVDTATYFTFWGQLWILVLFQLGGIGLITLTTAIIGAMGKRLSLRSEMTSVSTFQRDGGHAIWQLARRVARFTILVELAAALALFSFWMGHFPAPEAAWHAVFHSVSAFCNAGFSTFTDSLVQFADHPGILVIIAFLIVTGGLGFLTIGEIGRMRQGSRNRRRLSSHSYAVVIATAALLLFGTVGYAALEWNGVLGQLGGLDRIVNAFFASATARTAGFNSIDYSGLGNAAGFLTIMLMFVGGSPGSTAGGLKTTTLAVLVAWAWSRSRSRRFIGMHGRAIPENTLENTVAITILYLVVAMAAFFVLSVAQGHGGGVAEHRYFLPVAFECVSAFSTVGLSMGATAELTMASKIVIILLMFIGRVGLLAFFSAVFLRRRTAVKFQPAREDIIVG